MALRAAGLFLLLIFLGVQTHANERDLVRWIRKKPPIDQITVVGNRYFDDGEIRKRMYSKEQSLWRSLKEDRRRFIQRETVQRDTLEIKYMYLKEGFLGIRVRHYIEPIGDSATALVRVEIEEGRQFRFGPFAIQGDSLDKYYGGLYKAADKLDQDEPLDPFLIRQAEFDMKAVLANDGYPYAEVTSSIDTTSPDNVATMLFSIVKNQPVVFGDVTIEGLERYPIGVARRELKVKSGETYRRQDILDSQQRLYESGYFSTLSLTPQLETSDSLRPNFLLRVRERKARYLTLQTGFAQSDVRDLLVDGSAIFGKRNFLGSRKVDLTAGASIAVGEESRLLLHRYRVRYTEPWFFKLRMPLTLTGEIRPKVRSATQEYDVSRWLMSASTIRKFGREITTSFAFEYESVNISGIPADRPDVQIEEKDLSQRRDFTWTFRRDSRENLFVPDRGSLLDLSAEYYGGFLGGDEDFTRFQASYAWYQVVWPGWITATRFKVGYADPFGSTQVVPREDRFFVGGANSIRGVRENSLGAPDGSTVLTLFNQEFRWKTVQLFGKVPLLKDLFRTLPLYQSLFFDIGNGFAEWREVKWESLAYSYGTGIQIISPAGPIRIDYGRLIKTKRYGFTDRWHFTILYAF